MATINDFTQEANPIIENLTELFLKYGITKGIEIHSTLKGALMTIDLDAVETCLNTYQAEYKC